MQIRKPNRVSRPVRVTQRGSSTSYPHANRRKMALLRNRYVGQRETIGDRNSLHP